jgi:hypothetical protein
MYIGLRAFIVSRHHFKSSVADHVGECAVVEDGSDASLLARGPIIFQKSLKLGSKFGRQRCLRLQLCLRFRHYQHPLADQILTGLDV